MRPRRSSTEEDYGGQNGNRREWPGQSGGGGHKQRIGGCGNPKTGSDTMLGIDMLYSIGAKGHIYIYTYRCANMQETL
jgi:hypothetical protein